MIRDIDGTPALEIKWTDIDKWARRAGLTYMRRRNTLRFAGFRPHFGLNVYRAPDTERARALMQEIEQ